MSDFSSSDISIKQTKIKGLLIFEKKLYEDDRGWFEEIYRVDDIAKALGVSDLVIKQGSITFSNPGTLRGLHAEPQYKFVTPLTGRVFIAIADLRKNSETFAQVETFTFDFQHVSTPRQTLIISPGLANSMLVLGDEGVLYHYAVSSTYDPNIKKRSVRWDDSNLAIDWPIKNPIVSEEDKQNPLLKDLFLEKFR